MRRGQRDASANEVLRPPTHHPRAFVMELQQSCAGVGVAAPQMSQRSFAATMVRELTCAPAPHPITARFHQLCYPARGTAMTVILRSRRLGRAQDPHQWGKASHASHQPSRYGPVTEIVEHPHTHCPRELRLVRKRTMIHGSPFFGCRSHCAPDARHPVPLRSEGGAREGASDLSMALGARAALHHCRRLRWAQRNATREAGCGCSHGAMKEEGKTPAPHCHRLPRSP
jgi:hypothetical protein